MVMMIAANSFVHQQEGVQREEDEASGQRKGYPTPGADAPICPTRSWVSDAGNRRNNGGWSGVPLHRRGRGG